MSSWCLWHNHRTGPDLLDADSMQQLATTTQANLSLSPSPSLSQEKLHLKVKMHVMQQNQALLPLHQLMFSVLRLFRFSFLPQLSSHYFDISFFYRAPQIPVQLRNLHNVPSRTFSSLHDSVEELLAPNAARFSTQKPRRRAVKMRPSPRRWSFWCASAKRPANPAVQ